MSDRRPTNPELYVIREGSEHDVRHALPREVVAAVRRGVESGTIKGEVVWRCIRNERACRVATRSLIAEGSYVGRHVECGWALVIPVSDGGSET